MNVNNFAIHSQKQISLWAEALKGVHFHCLRLEQERPRQPQDAHPAHAR